MSKPLLGLLITAILSGLSTPAFSQPFNRHSITVSVGAARPRGELRPWFSDAPLVTAEYGFRVHRNFQLDGGFDAAFGAAGTRDWLPTQFGNLRIRDYQNFIPFGGRVILPLADERIHIYGGMGGAYMRYSESIQQPFEDSDFRIPCNICASRDGFGYYSTAGVNASFDRARRFRAGAGVKVYRGHTSGDAFGATPPRETTDRWVNLFGSFSVTF
jgi:hypothetical protein